MSIRNLRPRGNLLKLTTFLLLFYVVVRLLLLKSSFSTNDSSFGDENNNNNRENDETDNYVPGVGANANSAYVQREMHWNNAPAYSAGIYIAGQYPKNSTGSHCKWLYGLPGFLSYDIFNVVASPELGEKGPYRVLPYIIQSSYDNGRSYEMESTNVQVPNVTLCTHSTADQIYSIVEVAKRWEGPLSFAIFAPGLDTGLAIATLDRACRCEPAMIKVSVHLIFPAGRPPTLNEKHKFENSKGDCAASDLQWREAETERKRRGMIYPINVARNVARTFSRSMRVLVSDIELLPSAKLASSFMEMVRDKAPRIGVVFVIPVFEIQANEEPPGTKKRLLTAIRSGSAVYFHRFVCAHCQRFPGITRWILKPDPGKVKPLVVTKREYPHHRWEPVFIGTREDPFYAEEMSWEGRQDKMTQMLEMCLLNYRLVILDGAFLVHTPGIKHKPVSKTLSLKRELFFRPHEKKNARIYHTITQRLLRQYPSNRRCRQ